MIENNRLDDLLEESINDPSKRAQFLSELIRSTVYVIGKPEMKENADGVMAPAVRLLHITNKDGEYAVPFFSSRERLEVFAPGTPHVLETVGIDFLHSVQRSNVVLNPNSKYSKLYNTEEIKFILELFDFIKNGGDLTKAEKATFSVLENFPAELANILSDYFITKENVNKAFLVQVEYSEQEPHPLLIVDFKGDEGELFPEIGSVTEQYMNKIGKILEIIPYSDDLDPQILEKSIPIYFQQAAPVEEVAVE